MTARGYGAALGAIGLAMLVCGAETLAQDGSGEVPPAFVSRLEGTVALTRGATTEDLVLNAPVLEGDRLAVAQGRLAIQWPDGIILAADAGAVLDIVDARSVGLASGRVMVMAPPTLDSFPLRVLTSQASVTIGQPGRYAVQAGDPGQTWPDATVLDVELGEATLQSPGGRLAVSTAQQALVRGAAAPVHVSGPDIESAAFRQWALDAAAAAMPSASAASYLPDDLQVYGAMLDRNGSWDYDVEAGYIWYPQVGATWRPYTTGVWQKAGRLGWVWAGIDAWSWPTHHYGSWGIGKRGRWYWRPGRDWAPAHVRWAIGPGYIAWCPLDARGEPLTTPPFGARADAARIQDPRVDPWEGWTTVSSKSFGSRVLVERVAIDARTLPPADLGAFVTQPAAPARTRGGFSVGRRSDERPAEAQVSQQVDSFERPDLQPSSPAPTDEPAPWIGASRAAAPRVPGWPVNPGDHPVYAPVWPWYPVAGVGSAGTQEVPNPSPYERPTPFINPRWTSRPGSPFTVGLPQLRDPAPDAGRRPAAADSGGRTARPREGGSGRHGSRSGTTPQRVAPPSRPGPK